MTNAYGEYIDPLKGKAYEVGLKSAYLGDRLHTTVALFKIDRDNLAENMDLQLNLENLLDEKYYAYMSASGLSYSIYHYGTPRNVTVSFNYRF